MTDTPQVRLAAHDSALGRWTSTARRPHPAAVDLCLGYLGLQGDLRLPRELHLPSGAPAIVVNFGAPFTIADPIRPRETASCVDISFMGVHARPFVTETPDARDLLVVNLTPVGAYRVLGAPMDELANRWVALSDVLGARADELSWRLQRATDWAARFSALDAFLLAQVQASRAPRRDLGPAWRWMSRGAPAAALAQRLDVSHKHLIDQFRDQIGLAPKQVSRLARFNRVLRLSAREGRVDWAQVAQACGYFDQAHLINEVRAFAGETPRALRDRRAAFTLRADPAG